MRYFLILCLFILTACSNTLAVSGESLKGIGTQFVTVANVYKDGCDVSKTIPAAQCNSFRSFGQQFQKAYPLAVQLWEAARAANDTASQQSAEALISNLASSLSAFAVSATQTYQGGK